MKKVFLLVSVLLFIICSTVFSQTSFKYTYDYGNVEHYPIDIIELENEYFITLSVWDYSNNPLKCIVLNKEGVLINEFYSLNKSTRYIKKNNDTILSLNLENISEDNTSFDIRINIFNSDFEIQNTVLHSFNDYPSCVYGLGISEIILNDNNELIICIEHFQDDWVEYHEITFFRFSENFELINTKHFTTEENFNCFDIDQIPTDKGYLFTSWSKPPVNQLEARIIKLDSLFEFKEEFTYTMVDGANVEDASFIKFLTDSTFLYNVKRDINYPNNKFELIIADTSFNILNSTQAGKNNEGHRVAQVNGLDFVYKDAIYFGGSKAWLCTGDDGPPYYYVIAKVDSALNLKWEKFIEFDSGHYLHQIFATQDGGCIITGLNCYDYPSWNNEVEIIKLDSDGNYPTVGTNDIKISELLLYPNPSTDFINIRLGSHLKNVTIEIYDISGKKVLTQKLENTETQINIADFNYGTYIYKCFDKERVIETEKFIKQ